MFQTFEIKSEFKHKPIRSYVLRGGRILNLKKSHR